MTLSEVAERAGQTRATARRSVFALGESHELDGEPPDVETLVASLTRLWANALRLPTEEAASSRRDESMLVP